MMMNQLLEKLQHLNIRLYLKDGDLKCKAPKGALSEELKSQIKNRKRELIEVLSQAEKSDIPPLVPVSRCASLPISFAQQRLWFLDQLEPNSSFYNIPIALRLSGTLNKTALEQSINEIVRRHESLRTVFTTVNGQAVQDIKAHNKLAVKYMGLDDLPEQNRVSLLQNISHQEATKPFDLLMGPLLRLVLINLSDGSVKEESVLLFTLHHIISDGWSTEILIREFVLLYTTFSNGNQSALNELIIQYADFAYWQRHWLTGDELQRQVNYWQKQLKGASQLLELPIDKPRPVVKTYCGASYHFDIPFEDSKQLIALTQTYQATLFAVLLSVFSILLSRLSRQQDVCIGTAIANRNKLEIEGLIGFFVNTLVLRTDSSADLVFADFLSQVKKIVVDAQNHQDLPFEQLVEALQPVRDTSISPLFQVMFVLQNKKQNALQLQGLKISSIDDEDTASKFDLTLHINEAESGALAAHFEYNTDLFFPETIARFAAHYQVLLQSIIASPYQRISQLAMLSDSQEKQILSDWNDTQMAYPKGKCLHQLFEEQVKKTPNKMAVVVGNQFLTYQELNNKANQLAHFLSEQGVGSEMLLALCVERSLEMIIGLLGILKAGAAYVPIDPSYPKDRIEYMLADTQVHFVLTQELLLEKLPVYVADTICLDKNWLNIEKFKSNNTIIQNSSSDLAYVIYTSGSTGKPKGVMVSHQNAVHSTNARFSVYQKPVQSYLLLSSFSFDSSVAGLFWTLSQGGMLCIPTADEVKDPAALADLIVRYKISHLLALSSLYAILLEQSSSQLKSLKTVIVAGETCSNEVVKQHYEEMKNTALYNEYGPTEGSVWSSVYQAKAEDCARTLSIGQAIPNVRIYLLDQAQCPVPIGVQGEIYIAGEGIVRGYLNRPELTAERFIPDPFSKQGNRLYKTGDLARYRTDGNIEFMGRDDYQVKIRGFRIELGEIEEQILQHTGIKETVVLADKDKLGNRQLLAYSVNSDDEQVDAQSLRDYLKLLLPDYMLPGQYSFLESMPLMANGKVDRKALPNQEILDMASTKYSSPKTDTEKELTTIWSQLLNIERDTVGVDDDFFTVGGHSLLATQLLFSVQKKLNIRLSLKTFFEQPTISGQAFLIDFGEKKEVFVDLESEARLDADMIPINSKTIHVADSKAIFITGATGFLGAFLLLELLEQTQAKIYCLTRAINEQEALARLQSQLIRYELMDRVDFSRIIAVCGDLSELRLGLSEQRYGEIAETVDVIYHNGALVNFIKPYQALKAVNVSGTMEVLRLACSTKAKAVHYVSTLSVFSGVSSNVQGFSENDEPQITDDLDGGYSQSKWVAEKLLRNAAKRDFQVSIYRPGTVAGDSENGVWNTDDFLCRMLKGCIQLGFVPDGNSRMDMAPVDYMSQAIISLSLRPDSDGSIFHLNHTQPPFSKVLVDWFIESGFSLTPIPYNSWVDKLPSAAETRKDFVLSPLLSMFSKQETDMADNESESIAHYDSRQTQKKLTEMGIECPLVGDDLLKHYREYFIRSGFLKPVDKVH